MSTTPKYADRVLETSTTTGTGTYTLAGAVTGYRAFTGGLSNGDTVNYVAWEVDANGNPSGGWEVGRGTFTTSGTTLSRDVILASSNSGSAVSWSAGTRRLAVTVPAAELEPNLDSGFRLTLTTGVPVPTSSVTGASTIYLTPYKHNRIALWDGSGWRRYKSAEISFALSGLTSGKNYDVFLYDNAGTLTMELSAAWTNNTTRADALTTQDGVTCKSGTLTRRHLGTIRTTGTTTTEDSFGGTTSQTGGKLYVWNRDNQIIRRLRYHDTTDNWNYTTGTIRAANAVSAPHIAYVVGDAAIEIDARFVSSVYLQSNSSRIAVVGVGVDSTSAFSGFRQAGGNFNAAGTYSALGGQYVGQPGLGYHEINALESGADGTSCIFIGDNVGDGQQTGLVVNVLG